MTEHLLLILACSVVTFLPRILPLYLLKGRRLRARAEAFLNIIPYSSLAILVIRGILTADAHILPATILGTIISSAVAYWKENISLTVVSSIAVAYFVLNVFS